jgi:hypothetical protein
MKKFILIAFVLTVPFFAVSSFAADVVPNEIMMPGTQPNEVSGLESPDKCDNCHGGYDEARAYSNEPAYGWRGSAMGNAGRDPIFWATLAIAEQDFDGAGDLCIRCHSTGGWVSGRSTPTDGSGLAASDDNGVDCDACHKAANPDNSEHLGVMFDPFIANAGDNPGPGSEGFYGSGMLSLWGSSNKLGPYNDADARHQWMQSRFHRGTISSPEGDITKGDNICGSCHDVSNSAVGDLAPNGGTQPGAPSVISSKDDTDCDNDGVHDDPGPCLGGPIEDKAAFNNPPYAYGIVERTYSEWKSGALDDYDVRNFSNLPADLQVESGALNMAYQSALLAGGTYEDGTIRTFTCMSCHMRPDIGEGCNKANVLTRNDLPKHDMSGGNYWMWPLIKYQDQKGTLRLGGGLTALQISAMDAGQLRAEDQLRMAASLEVIEDASNIKVKVTNLTGHKLITGYPEGRRMWLNIKWYNDTNVLVGEDGAYGPLGVTFTNPVDGSTFEPWSILDLDGTNTKIYEAHYSVTKDWASTIQALHGSDFALSYDRKTGAVDCTVGQFLSVDGCGTSHPDYHDTFHFVLNNHVSKDNRIPPYGFDPIEARKRNALPVLDSQYGGGGASYNGLIDVYEYWDEVTLNQPDGAVGADITLYYQGTSWEYILFLWTANNEQNAFLGQEGVNMLDAWLNADPANPMVPPFVMATATWGTACNPTGIPENICNGDDDDCDEEIDEEFVTTPSTCGVGECASSGQIQCINGLVEDTCASLPAPEPSESTCDDNKDNDCDGATDTADQDCGGTTACSAYMDKGLCNNDPNCEWGGSPHNGMCQDKAVCSTTEEPEITCNDGVDNDCDGLTDCADTADCGNEAVCQIDCSVYTTRNLCNAQPACKWNNKNKVCTNL